MNTVENRDTEKNMIPSEEGREKQRNKEHVGLLENKYQDGRLNSNHSSSYVKSRWTEYYNF